MMNYNQTRVDVGNDPLLKDCYTKVILPILAAVPNITIKQDSKKKNTINMQIPTGNELSIAFNIPVRDMQYGSCFKSDILLLKMRVKAFYNTRKDKTITMEQLISGGFTEEELKGTPISVVLTAADEMRSEIPAELQAGYDERLKVVNEKYQDLVSRLVFACLVESDSDIVITNSTKQNPTHRS